MATQQIVNSSGSSIGGLFSLTLATARFRGTWGKAQAGPQERIITLDEVLYHDHSNDCWIVIYDRVYDVTKFLHQHPGGFDVLLENAGRDATIAFRGTGHSSEAINALRPFFIGSLPRSECIYRKPGGFFLSDLPE